MADQQTSGVPDGWEVVPEGVKPPPTASASPTVPSPPMQGGGDQEGWGAWAIRHAKDIATSPEGIAGAASFVPAIGNAGAGIVGAGASIYQDVKKGEKDPWTIGAHAAEHGLVSGIPWGMGKIAETGVGGLVSAALSKSPIGKALELAKAYMKPGVSPVNAIHQLPMDKMAEFATPAYREELMQQMSKIAMEHSNKTGAPTWGGALKEGESSAFDAAHALLNKIDAYVTQHGFDPADLAKAAGMPHPAQAFANKAKMAAGLAKSRLDHYTNMAKMMTSAASPYIFGTDSPPGVSAPPKDKP